MSSHIESKSPKRPVTVYAAIISNLVIAIAKFIVAFITRSSAMLSEGIHSVADTGNQLLLLIGIHRGRKPADTTHPFGYGKEVYFWSLIVAVILFGVGGGMSVYEGITHIQHPSDITDPTWNYIVLAIAFIAEGTSWVIAFRHLLHTRHDNESVWKTLRRSKDPEIYVVLGEDTAALIGIVIAFGGVFLSHLYDMPLLDGAASLVIGIVLIIVAIFLAIESRSLLVGESADNVLVQGIHEIAETESTILRLRHPLTMHLAPHEVLLAIDVEFIQELDSRQVAGTVDKLEKQIREKFPEIKYIYIESDLIKQSVQKQRGDDS